MVIVTDPLVEEYFASAILRNNELCGAVKHESRYNEISGLGLATLGWRAPHAFGGLFEPQAVYKHTLHPIGFLFDRVRYKNMTFMPRGVMRMCVNCVIEDVSRFGTAFIHRTHVAPNQLGIQVCHLHATNLLDRCPSCHVEIQNHKITHIASCITKQSQITSTAGVGLGPHRYAKFIYDILNLSEGEKYRSTSLRTMNRALEKQGYSRPTIEAYFQYCIDEDQQTGTKRSDYERARDMNKNLARTPMQLFTRVAFLLYGDLRTFIEEMEANRI